MAVADFGAAVAAEAPERRAARAFGQTRVARHRDFSVLAEAPTETRAGEHRAVAVVRRLRGVTTARSSSLRSHGENLLSGKLGGIATAWYEWLQHRAEERELDDRAAWRL